jgi:hypothetical protein
LASLLDHVTHMVLENSSLHLHFTQADKNFYSMMNNKDQIATLGQICQNVFGRNLLVKLTLLEKSSDLTPAVRSDAGGQDPLRPSSPAGADEILKEPLVRSFVDTFRAEIVQIKKK